MRVIELRLNFYCEKDLYWAWCGEYCLKSNTFTYCDECYWKGVKELDRLEQINEIK